MAYYTQFEDRATIVKKRQELQGLVGTNGEILSFLNTGKPGLRKLEVGLARIAEIPLRNVPELLSAYSERWKINPDESYALSQRVLDMASATIAMRLTEVGRYGKIPTKDRNNYIRYADGVITMLTRVAMHLGDNIPFARRDK